MLAKLLGIAVLVWFYKTAKQVGENAIQWSIFGVISFFLSATITYYAISQPLLDLVAAKSAMALAISQLPIVFGLGAAYLFRKIFLLKQNSQSVD